MADSTELAKNCPAPAGGGRQRWRLDALHHAQDHVAATAGGGIQDHGEFVLPQFLGGLNDDHKWPGARRRAG